MVYKNTPNCLCEKQEDGYQFFFICKTYSTARYVMFDRLFALLGISFIDTNTLLWDQEHFVCDVNNKSFAAVSIFISMSDIFTKNKQLYDLEFLSCHCPYMYISAL